MCAAPKGNKFHELRKVDGREKNFSTGDLWNLWKEFVIWAKDNPKIIFQVSMGKTVQVPVERPLVLEEFYTWVDATYNKTIHQYFDNLNDAYDEYLGVVTRIKNHRFSDLAVGSLAGVYNPQMTSKILGLADKIESKQEIKAEVKSTPVDLSKLSLEEKIALRDLQKKVRGDDSGGTTID